MLLLIERLDNRLFVFLLDPTLSAIALDVGQLVDAQRVLLVEGNHVQLADSRAGLGGGRELDKGKAVEEKCKRR